MTKRETVEKVKAELPEDVDARVEVSRSHVIPHAGEKNAKVTYVTIGFFTSEKEEVAK